MSQPNKVSFNNEDYFYEEFPVLDYNSLYGDHFKVQGKDSKGNYVTIIWEINDPHFSESVDDEFACDWDNPIEVTLD